MPCAPFGVDVESPLVFAGQEALRHGDEQVHGRHHQRDATAAAVTSAVSQADAQRPAVQLAPGIEDPLEQPVQAAVTLVARRVEEAAAQHRRQADRHEAGDQNRGGNRDRELVQQAARRCRP